MGHEATVRDTLRETSRRFLAERCPRTWVRHMLDDPRGTTDEVWRGLCGLGLVGLVVPERLGGQGGSWADMGVVLEEMGRALHPGPFFSTAVAAVALIEATGSGEVQAALLSRLAKGDLVAVPALLEPAGRYDWSAPATEAKQAGAGWELRGTKMFVPDGEAADVLLVTARWQEGLGLFAVEASEVETTHLETIDSTRKQARVDLESAAARLIGGGDMAAALGAAVDRIVAGLVADGVGAAEAALDMATDYAKQRVQFGRPVGSFQAVQHLLADMLRNVELARAGAELALAAADAGDAAACHRAATIAMAFAGDALYRVTADAIQVFGGIGFTWEHDIHLYYRRTLAMGHALGGASEFQEEYARLLLEDR